MLVFELFQLFVMVRTVSLFFLFGDHLHIINNACVMRNSTAYTPSIIDSTVHREDVKKVTKSVNNKNSHAVNNKLLRHL